MKKKESNAVIQHLKKLRTEPDKNSGFNGIQTPDLPVQMLCQLSYVAIDIGAVGGRKSSVMPAK